MFKLAGAIDRDTVHVCDLTLSTVRLMNDSRYDWLVLVPRQAAVSELFDLSPDDQVTLWQEASLVAELLKLQTDCDKVNIANLGNIEPQLHVHIVARHKDDPAWPGPVWGHSAAAVFEDDELANKIRHYAELIQKKQASR